METVVRHSLPPKPAAGAFGRTEYISIGLCFRLLTEFCGALCGIFRQPGGAIFRETQAVR